MRASEAILEKHLEHFGVKGMKWGVRRNRTTDKLSKEDRKAAKANMKVEGDLVVDRILTRMFGGGGGLGDKPYDELDPNDRTIKAGAEFYRTTPRKNEVFRERTYVSTNKEDRDRYNGVLPDLSGRGGKRSYKVHYEKTMELTKDLTMPSEKARIDAFNEMMNTNSVQVGKKTMTGREFLVKAGYGRDVKKISDQEAGRRYFDNMNQNASFDTPLNSAYFNTLRKKGYNALQDDNDTGMMTKDPIILLEPKSTVRTTSVRQLTARDINEAQKNFTDPIMNPRTKEKR